MNPYATYLPRIVEKTHQGTTSWDLFSRLLHDRIVFLGSVISPDAANVIIGQLLFLESEDPEREIFLYVNSPGGDTNAALAIYDTMQYVRPDISTLCIGEASRQAAILLAGGTKGKRRALPHSRLLMHQPAIQGVQGQASDLEIHAREVLRTKSIYHQILARHTGKPIEQVASDIERHLYLTANQAVEYGLIDEVLSRGEEG